MIKKVKSVLFVACSLMVLLVQPCHADDKDKGHGSSPRPQEQASREASHGDQRISERQNRRESPEPAAHRESAPEQVSRRSYQEVGGPRVYAVAQAAPVENNNLFHRHHHEHWQPRYNFYDDQYHFYPYVNIASTIELSAGYVVVVFGGQNFYYDDGTFYVQDTNGQYEAVPPPVGIIVPLLPTNARQIVVDGQVFYRYKGVCYVPAAQGYEVVAQVADPSDNS